MSSPAWRGFWTRVFTPIARGLTRMHVSPDAVTIVGVIGVCVGAFAFYPRHDFLIGTLVITAFVFSDTIDGTMARMTGRSSSWGAFLDSTLDRVGDASIFVALLFWFAGRGHETGLAIATTICLIAGIVISYARARAESLGMTASVGFAERTVRLVTVLVVTGLDGMGIPYVQAWGLWALAAASVVTVVQRMWFVRGQAIAGGAHL